MIRRLIEKRRVKRVLKQLVEPGTVEAVLRDGTEPQTIKQGRIEFVLTFVRGESPVEVSERVARVVELAGTHGATVQAILGALVVMTFGTRASIPSTASRFGLVEALRVQLAGDIKLVHGAADGHYGMLGSKERVLSFTFLVPRFDHALGALSRLAFGENEESRT